MNGNIRKYYKLNHEKKVFLSKISDESNCYIIYTNNNIREKENYSKLFTYYLPAYVLNLDKLNTLFNMKDNWNVDEEKIIMESKRIWKEGETLAHRDAKRNGVFGELFLDFYSRVVLNKNFLISFSSKGPFNGNQENKGFDQNYYYFNNDGEIVLVFSESKFVTNLSSAKAGLMGDIKGNDDSIGHLTEKYMNRYLSFIMDKGSFELLDDNDRKEEFLNFIYDLNKESFEGKKYLEILIEKNIKIDLVLFAIYKDTRITIEDVIDTFSELHDESLNKLKEMGFSDNNININIVFVPTVNESMEIKNAIEEGLFK